MKIYNKFVESKKEPSNKNDIWFDGSIIRLYKEGNWVEINLSLEEVESLKQSASLKLVDELPEVGEPNIIYLILNENSVEGNNLSEYVYINDTWEVVGGSIPINLLNLSNSLVIVSHTYGKQSILDAEAYKYIVDTFDLESKKGASLPCLFKKDSQSIYNFGTLTYSSNNEVSRIDILLGNGLSSSELNNDKKKYNPFNGISNYAYLFDKQYNILIPLGSYNGRDFELEDDSIEYSKLSSGARKTIEDFIEDKINDINPEISESVFKQGNGQGSALQTPENTEFTDKNTNSSTYNHPLIVEAYGDYSTTLGGNAQARAKRAVAQGHRCVARGETSHAEGHCAVVEYTDGTYNGYGSHAEGYSTLVDGVYSHAEGSKTIAHGNNAHAEGGSTIVSSDFAHTEGYGTYTGDRNNAPQFESPDGGESGGNGGGIVAPDVEGKKGVAAHAEGNFTIAEGNYSHAEGRQTKSLGEASHAEGNETTAEGNYSHSQGWVSHAIGGYSHAEGQNTRARGEASHSEGNNTDANGPHSHAEGVGTQTHSEVMGQHVEGHWNHITDGVMIVGCGTSNDDRKNAIEVKQGGRVFVKGVGGYEGTDIDGKKDLATALGEIDTYETDFTIENLMEIFSNPDLEIEFDKESLAEALAQRKRIIVPQGNNDMGYGVLSGYTDAETVYLSISTDENIYIIWVEDDRNLITGSQVFKYNIMAFATEESVDNKISQAIAAAITTTLNTEV